MSTLTETTLGAYLDAVGSSTPTPGGGSVAAVVAAFASALGSMVAALSRGKSDNPQVAELAEKFTTYRNRFLQLSLDDQLAFAAVMDVLRLSKSDPSRAAQLESTVQLAAEIPLTMAQSCLDLLGLLESMIPMASRHAVSDIGAAGHLARAALSASLLNVHINATFLKNRPEADRFKASALRLETEGQIRCQRIADHVVASISS
ncbi:cyclodeaminase/cyclohydrolase family protein [Candidatus Bipolaricaulota bacterium]|nr:cyclodeaminase/cyclohydrolase family protein [Candidatus Bipolaricaulota bacterium]TFH11402.1 MAG: hypothetical protein E4H08_01315 [Candidatus Atribacteria bacterium]